MKRILLIILAVVILGAAMTAFAITRGGKLVTPTGEGSIQIGETTFEAYPLPDYAADMVGDDYKSYLVEVEPGIKIHILEVGSGYPVYMQHGNPTSGFLYRKVAAELPKDELRLIMPTMIGLGFSSKVPVRDHTIENHMRWMNAALEQLDLDGLVYVGQDWGGAVGLGALSLSPELLEGAVILNTGFTPPAEAFELSTAHTMAKTPIVGELLLENLVSIFDRIHEVQGDPELIPQAVADLYGRPVTESGNRKAPLALMRMVPDSPDHPTTAALVEIEAYVHTLDVPAEIVWGMRDPIFAPALPTMQGYFPNAPTTETQAGHFLQEEVPVEIAAAIIRVVERVNAPLAPPAEPVLERTDEPASMPLDLD